MRVSVSAMKHDLPEFLFLGGVRACSVGPPGSSMTLWRQETLTYHCPVGPAGKFNDITAPRNMNWHSSGFVAPSAIAQCIGTKYLVQSIGTKYWVPGIWYQVIDTKELVPSIWYQVTKYFANNNVSWCKQILKTLMKGSGIIHLTHEDSISSRKKVPMLVHMSRWSQHWPYLQTSNVSSIRTPSWAMQFSSLCTSWCSLMVTCIICSLTCRVTHSTFCLQAQ